MREHVHDPRRFGVAADEELLDARVGGDDHLPAHRHHRRVGHQVVGGGAGAVDDDRGGAGQAGQRGDRGDLERAACPLEPGAQVVQVDRHGGQRRRVVEAAGKAVRQFGLLAVPHVGQEPGPVVRLERGAGDLPAGRQPYPGAGFRGELGQDLEPDPAPLHHPVRRADLHRAPDRPGRHQRGLRGQRGRPDRHAEPSLGQADRRGEADRPGPDYENVHEPTVSRVRGAPARGAGEVVSAGRSTAGRR